VETLGVRIARLVHWEGAYAGARAVFEVMAHLETLGAIATFSLLPNGIEHEFDELDAFRVITLIPIIPGSRLAKHNVTRPKQLHNGSGTHAVHHVQVGVHQDDARDVVTNICLIIIHMNALKLEIGVALG